MLLVVQCKRKKSKQSISRVCLLPIREIQAYNDYDPESGRIRKYYPDFFAKMLDGTYQLIEVKSDHMIDDTVIKAKKDAAEEMATCDVI